MTSFEPHQPKHLIVDLNQTLAEQIVALYGDVYWYNPLTMRFVHLSLVEPGVAGSQMLQSQELDLPAFLREVWVDGTSLIMVSSKRGKLLSTLGHWVNASLLSQSHQALQVSLGKVDTQRSLYKTTLRQIQQLLEEEIDLIAKGSPLTEQQLRALIQHRAALQTTFQGQYGELKRLIDHSLEHRTC